ncbi:MAG: ferritin family protein, partial [Pseudomonadota bacterium]|nr:ferritin family protein [Pseudomonadota bacterium]
PEIAKLFKRMARYSDLHADEVQNLAEGLSLPAIAPWAFKWNCLEGPESPCMDDVSYLMNRLQALDLALHNEIRGRDFYAGVVTSSPDPEVRRLAEQMFEEESVHVDLLKEWIALKAQDDEAPLEDLDPPNAPE